MDQQDSKWVNDGPETVLLVGVQTPALSAGDVRDCLDELALLCATAGAKVEEQLSCRMPRPHPATYVGKGKAEEIAALVQTRHISTVVFDDDLSPSQGRNLEEIFKTKVVDRTQVILDIFAQRAQTKEGQLQIELAQLEYLMPRLRHMWTHLERQKGGVGMHGPGEKQLELDRRRLEERIARIKKELEKVRSHRSELRRGRRRHGWALISLVGYTNAGKSTLLNALTGSKVFAYDKLFATLDPTTRQIKLQNNQQALMTDTVGFIRKLPHHLVEAFKATLEELVQADVLVHVIDAAHPQVDQQIHAVHAVLKALGVQATPMVAVFNKIDLPEAHAAAQRLQRLFPHHVTVSALKGTGLNLLTDCLADRLHNRGQRIHLRVPAGEGRVLAAIRSAGSVRAEELVEDVYEFDVNLPERLLGLCRPFIVPSSENDPDAHDHEQPQD